MGNYEITHHGVKGQRWGIRRFQNKDGTLTFLGKRRKKTSGKSTKNTEEKKESEKKSIKDMTDDELRARINRMQLEKQYNSLVKEMSTKQVSKGQKMVEGMLDKAVKNIGEQYTTYLLGTALNKMSKKDVVNPKKGQKDK